MHMRLLTHTRYGNTDTESSVLLEKISGRYWPRRIEWLSIRRSHNQVGKGISQACVIGGKGAPVLMEICLVVLGYANVSYQLLMVHLVCEIQPRNKLEMTDTLCKAHVAKCWTVTVSRLGSLSSLQHLCEEPINHRHPNTNTSSCISLTWWHSFLHSPDRQGHGLTCPSPARGSSGLVPAQILPGMLSRGAALSPCAPIACTAQHSQHYGFIKSVGVTGCQGLLESVKTEGNSSYF